MALKLNLKEMTSELTSEDGERAEVVVATAVTRLRDGRMHDWAEMFVGQQLDKHSMENNLEAVLRHNKDSQS